MSKAPSAKAAQYNNKFDNIVTKLKAVVAQARELDGRLDTVTQERNGNR